MALKSKRPSAGVNRGGKETPPSFIGKMRDAGVLLTKKSSKQHPAVAGETIEARLARKATVADTKTFASESLGQMTREQRHKLFFGD